MLQHPVNAAGKKLRGRILWRALVERLQKELLDPKYRDFLRFLNLWYDETDNTIKHILTGKPVGAALWIDQGPCEVNYKGYQRTTKSRLLNKPINTVPHEHPITYEGYSASSKLDMWHEEIISMMEGVIAYKKNNDLPDKNNVFCTTNEEEWEEYCLNWDSFYKKGWAKPDCWEAGSQEGASLFRKPRPSKKRKIRDTRQDNDEDGDDDDDGHP